jgi:hypothetical protein
MVEKKEKARTLPAWMTSNLVISVAFMLAFALVTYFFVFVVIAVTTDPRNPRSPPCYASCTATALAWPAHAAIYILKRDWSHILGHELNVFASIQAHMEG